ncbi:MAG: HAMP domain-containing histidine kinase [Spirochaetaceae bacterium]|nr:MAG: HAMP domain-containing histidine kinase [Spirochaetaceae bacterium]
MRRSLLYQIYPVYLIAIVLAVGSLTFAATRVIRGAFHTEKESQLRSSAELVTKALGAEVLAAQTKAQPSRTVELRLRELVGDLPLRFSVIGVDGVVLADTHIDSLSAEDHSRRPEVVRALREGTGSDTRRSFSTGENSLYVAVAIFDYNRQPIAVVRAAASVQTIDQRVREAFTVIILAGLLIITATTVLTLIIIKRIHRPLMAIQDAARRFAGGDLDHRIRLRAPQEINSVAETLNSMADQIASTIGGITAQRNELEAILSAMVEGVIVVDQHRRISSINRAAASLFGVDHRRVKGKSIIEALRNAEIDQLAEESLQSAAAREATIVIYDNAITHVQVHATTLQSEGETGVLLVLNDITRMKQLESVRRDFVANVSHELRTPITSILGFVETLRDGALDDSQAAKRFIDIIHSHSTRLNLIIEDLLSLSRLESFDAEIPMEECRVEAVVTKAVQACEPEAERRAIRVQQTSSGSDTAQVNPALLEQALVNLVNNAVKYSPDGSSVEITTRNDGPVLLISVADHGSGIPRRDLTRVFERFYRVDHARSRDMGGTGLGLAIVKHIALAHNGEVTAESIEGRGSRFTLSIPQNWRGRGAGS